MMMICRCTRHRPNHFDPARLPDPLAYYERELGALHGRGVWRDAVCPFHQDTRPSLRVNTQSGAFRCMVCGERGGDVIDFQKLHHGQNFKAACQALGVWRGLEHV